MKTYFRQIILNGFLIAAMNMMAGSSDALLAFSTKGPDYYADGTPVQEGECYALVWTRNGSEFAGVDLNGQVVDTVNNAVVVALPLAKAKSDGTVHCPTTLFQIDEAYAKAHAAGTFALILLDTRVGDNDGNLVTTGALGQVNGWGFAAKSQVKAVAATPAAVPTADDAVCAKTDRTSAIPAGEDIPQPKITGIEVRDGVVTLTVTGTSPRLIYNIASGGSPGRHDNRHAAVHAVSGHARVEGEITMETPVVAGQNFFRVVRN